MVASTNKTSTIGVILAYLLYLLCISMGAYLFFTKPEDILHPELILRAAGAALVLLGIVEIIVTYSNRK
jgi:hypothetical protein